MHKVVHGHERLATGEPHFTLLFTIMRGGCCYFLLVVDLLNIGPHEGSVGVSKSRRYVRPPSKLNVFARTACRLSPAE